MLWFRLFEFKRKSEAENDNYIDICVEFDGKTKYRRRGIVVYYWIKDLGINIVIDGKLTKLSGDPFCYQYGLIGGYKSRKDGFVDIMNAAIKEYKLMKSNSL
jgi:hypothetical protein